MIGSQSHSPYHYSIHTMLIEDSNNILSRLYNGCGIMHG